MDSDDEEILQNEAKTRATGYYNYSRRYRGCSPVRLYEREEDKLMNKWIISPVEKGTTHDPRNDPPKHGVQYRVLRFCETVKGFHTGTLDLAGRHERRYRSIQKRWTEFAAELSEVLEHSTETEVPLLDSLGKVIMIPGDPPEPLIEVSFDVDPVDLLREFEKKWRLTVYSVGAMKGLYEEVKELIESNPEAKFQTLCLSDLPPELLHLIMEACGVDGARRLGAACRMLRTVSLPYIYQERRLELKFSPKWDEVHGDDPLELHNYVRSLAMSARDKFIQEVLFLQSRSDITQSIESLAVLGWTETYYEMAGWQPFDDNVVEYLLPISLRIHGLIACCPNLKKLVLSCIVIGGAMGRSVVALQKLEQLHIIFSKVAGSPTPHRPASNVLNLRILIADPLDLSAWTFMSSLSNVRWLSLSASSNGWRLLPPQEIVQNWNPFVTVERASIDGIQPVEWLDLVTLFTSASLTTSHRLPLTHLKISLTYGISDDIVDGLLTALEGSALQCLVLDGTTYGDPELIGDIARKLPNLTSLTLAYRDSCRQSKCSDAIWPSPTWEYAQRLSRFSRLAHFGWNLDVSPSVSPAIMPLFEDGYPNNWWDYTMDEWFEPSEQVTRLLAVHCPPLVEVVFLPDTLNLHVIIRSPDGSIGMERSHLPRSYYEQHNPSLSTSWPLVGPTDS